MGTPSEALSQAGLTQPQSNGTATKSDRVLALLNDSTKKRTYQEIASMVGCSTQLVFSTAKKSGLTRRPQTTQVTTATTRIDKIDAQIRALQQRREEIREKQRVQLKATQDGKILIWMNGQGVTGTNEQMDQLRVLLQEKAEGQAVGAA